jgi:hypothetical protein
MFVVRRTAGRNHYYVDIDIAPRHRVPGVTTIVKVMANAKLEKYGAVATAEYAVNNWATLDAMPPADRLKAINGGRWEKRDAAGNVGKDVHRYGEHLIAGESVDIPDHLQGYVESYLGFMDASQIAADHVEVPCYSATHRYAGTTDIFGSLILPDTPEWDDVPRDDAGRSFGVLDPKTGRGVYESAALQLVAYAHSEFLITAGATSADPEKRSEIRTPQADFAAAVHIHPDGTPATLIRTDMSAEAFDGFLTLVKAYDLQQRSDDLLYPPTPYPFTRRMKLMRDESPS